MKTLIIITNWNDEYRTLRCINSLVKLKLNNFDILVTDNNSIKNNLNRLIKGIKKKIKNKKINFIKRKTFDYNKINSKAKKIILLQSDINTGCTGGYNIGYHFGLKNNYDYICRIDNDCTVNKDFLYKNISFLEKNLNYVGVNSKVCYQHLKKRIQWVGVKISYKASLHRSLRLFKKPKNINEINNEVLSSNWKGIINTDTLNGPGSVIRTKVLRKSGLSDPEFFFGPEDMELSLRLRKFGKLAVNLDSTIYHEVAKSAKITGINTRKYYEIKSYLYFLKKLRIDIYFFGLIYNLIRIVFTLILSTINKEKKNYLKVLFKANKDFFNSRLGIYDLKNNNPNKKESINLYLKKINLK